MYISMEHEKYRLREEEIINYLSNSSLNSNFLLCLSNMLEKSASPISRGLPSILVLSLKVTCTMGVLVDCSSRSSMLTRQIPLRAGGIWDKTLLALLASAPKGLNLTTTLVKYLVIILWGIIKEEEFNTMRQ